MHLFVTGGTGGIGREIVLAAVKEGHAVAFTYLNEKDAAAAICAEAKTLRSDARCFSLPLDVRRSVDVDDAAARAIEELGHIDALVANAGFVEPKLAVLSSDEDWQQTIDTNLSGTFFIVRAFLPEFMARKDGRIVIVSSLAYLGLEGSVAYSASKAGLHGLSSTIAREYGKKGIRCNVVVPGAIDTRMSRHALTPEWGARLLDSCSLGRFGQRAAEVADAGLYLLSDRASYVNGRELVVDGGIGF